MPCGKRRVLVAAATVFLVSGTLLGFTEGYLRVKAVVASVLIDRALARHLEDGGAHPPWPWADMHPIALLECPRLKLREPVLAGASGESMAFGIGHITGTTKPNAEGNCALAGHRDTKMAWLGRLQTGDAVTLRTHRQTLRYRITRNAVVDRHDIRVLASSADSRLTLVTCYPLDGIFPGDDRLIVEAAPDPDLP